MVRLAETRALLDAGFPDGAYYLAGYAVECGFKACIARQTRRHDFPPEPRTVADMYTHDLEKLVGRAELRVQLHAEISGDPAFADNWRTVRVWSERSRYGRVPFAEAERLHEAITDRRHGVLRWIRQYW